MPDTLLPLEPQTPAAAVAKKFDLGEEAEALLRDGLTAEEFFRLLQKDRLYFDAIRMLVIVLHKLYAVQWAYNAARSDLNIKITEDDLPILDVVEAWIAEPNESNRRAAMKAAEDGNYETAAAWAAAAAAWTGGSLAPVGLPIVPPAPDLTAKAAGGAISMVAVQNSAQIEKRAARLVDMGLEFAKLPVPPPLYADAESAAPAAQPAAAPAQPPRATLRPVTPQPLTPRKPEQQTAFKGLKPVTPAVTPPLRPAPRRPTPPPPPPSEPGPGTWSTDPL